MKFKHKKARFAKKNKLPKKGILIDILILIKIIFFLLNNLFVIIAIPDILHNY